MRKTTLKEKILQLHVAKDDIETIIWILEKRTAKSRTDPTIKGALQHWKSTIDKHKELFQSIIDEHGTEIYKPEL